MPENCGVQIVDKLKAAAQARGSGLNCPKALLEAYQDELGDKISAVEELAARLPGILGEPHLCDVFAVTVAIIVHLTGNEDSCADTVTRLRKEYGSSECGSGGKETSLCTLRMKDCVLMIQWARSEYEKRIKELTYTI